MSTQDGDCKDWEKEREKKRSGRKGRVRLFFFSFFASFLSLFALGACLIHCTPLLYSPLSARLRRTRVAGGQGWRTRTSCLKIEFYPRLFVAPGFRLARSSSPVRLLKERRGSDKGTTSEAPRLAALSHQPLPGLPCTLFTIRSARLTVHTPPHPLPFSFLLQMANRMPACVVDVGTGYTKMGFAGNSEPSYIFPSGATKPRAVLAVSRLLAPCLGVLLPGPPLPRRAAAFPMAGLSCKRERGNK